MTTSMKFDWDNENLGHLARHDLESHLRNGEERVAQIGETDAGRILIVSPLAG